MINAGPVTDGRRAGSLTWAGLFNTYYWIDPATRIAGVIMTQILPFVDKPALVAYRQFERGIYHALGLNSLRLVCTANAISDTPGHQTRR